MSVICKCNSCGCLFPEADIKFKKAIMYDVLKHCVYYTTVILSSVNNGIHEIPIFLISRSDKTLHCPVCEALHPKGFKTV